jgi:hypothetical protein
MKKFILLLALTGAVFLQQAKAERHIFRASWSDATPLLIADLFVEGLSSAVTGTETKMDDFKGMVTLGYRYKLSRLAVGADVSYANLSQRVRLPAEEFSTGSEFSIRERGNYFLFMPALEFVYVKLPFVDFYTSMAVGYMYSSVEQTGLTSLGNSFLAHSEKPGGSSFAFQYNPLGIRVGVDRLAAFAEAGIGFRGFVCLGVDYRF